MDLSIESQNSRRKFALRCQTYSCVKKETERKGRSDGERAGKEEAGRTEGKKEEKFLLYVFSVIH